MIVVCNNCKREWTLQENECKGIERTFPGQYAVVINCTCSDEDARIYVGCAGSVSPFIFWNAFKKWISENDRPACGTKFNKLIQEMEKEHEKN